LGTNYSSLDDFKEDLEREVGYIYNRLIRLHSDRKQLSSQEESVRLAIHNVLVLIRDQRFDIPFITKYRAHEFKSAGLTDQDIWLIFNLEQEYAKYRLQFNQMRESLVRIIKAVHNHSNSDPSQIRYQVEIL
jgi:transcriptional accessory protein Tex/SPT6